jgi:hypothetical protein
MGGFIRRVFRQFTSKPSPAPVAQTIVSAQPVQKAIARRVSKPYSGDTIMTSAAGLEEEANVKKAELGGTILKKKKKYA